jgi:hypothetical protein
VVVTPPVSLALSPPHFAAPLLSATSMTRQEVRESSQFPDATVPPALKTPSLLRHASGKL